MKKSLSAIFCLVIMLSLSVPVSASAFDSSNYASSNSSAVAQSQYEMLMDSFGFDSSLSDIVYPSNYGGAYINSEGALVVMQTNSISSSSRGGNFASVLNEAGSFILDTVSYSYNELNSLKSEIDDACLSFQSNPSAFSDDQANLLNSISFFYISQKDNSIIVGITDLNDSKRNSFLDMFGASDAYMLIEGLHTTTTASLKPGGDIVSPAGPLSIGWPVYFYDENDNQPLTISNVLVTDAMNLGGDSGGIVYCKSGSNYYAIGTASGSKHSTNNLTEDTFIECYVSQMIYAIQPLDCSYLPLS